MLSRSVYFVYHEEHEGHEGLGNYYISISNFVLFATFVVIMSGSILVATSPRWVFRGENFFTVKPEEAKTKRVASCFESLSMIGLFFSHFKIFSVRPELVEGL